MGEEVAVEVATKFVRRNCEKCQMPRLTPHVGNVTEAAKAQKNKDWVPEVQ